MKFIIKVYSGQNMGYVKSVHPSKGTFDVTSNLSEAKTNYRSETAVQNEIELLSKMSNGSYVFTYVPM